ncbi:hypothetical protein CLAFUW4_12271 [Fulvia fulva]|uniref:Uncharacterized protein n=1 Tax=Passalora fulva TaxID=5499 RepID=A0A9Q8USR5_PASFU|nr:uncharacterized protein CLAFUR5_11301 [Fulvia fulva]KAK4617777.1 hypothetical protein CLAFUR4_12276 [Fulvia fulva]KAK4618539.1 hypothetical protein CLAFUR0_12287 [Fulvia fulva]UJO21068.1 hypothetical protein CLAFUR5_11301 [Fulvia fulva]WPV18679.1 hypothetical protein CLAFUW4_12271 [Fulvia fulva]WPV32981.1 hypothetical protein CLAFUW7_12278 [Fulvia fulva]
MLVFGRYALHRTSRVVWAPEKISAVERALLLTTKDAISTFIWRVQVDSANFLRAPEPRLRQRLQVPHCIWNVTRAIL